MTRPSHLGPVRPLLSSESSVGIVDGEDVEWPTGPIGDTAPSDRDQWKQPVRVATTANIDVEVDLEDGDTIDARTLATGDRVLVKDQTAAAENGIYVVGEGRAPDMDESDEVVGAVVYVVDGDTYAGTEWAVTNTTEPELEVDDITWEQGAGGTVALPWFDVTDYGATGDGSTDDTTAIQDTIDAAAAAGGGVVFFPVGVYIVGGALQDTGRSNAQLLLPRIDYVDSEQITIELRGAFPPPPIMSVIGTTPVPDGHSVIKGTLNTSGGTAPALIGAHGPVGTFGNFTNLMVRIQDLTLRMPSNPVLTALDLSLVAACDLDNVIVDVGSYYVEGLTEPTTTTSVAIKCPTNNNGAYTRLGAVNVIGFYTGFQYSEHTHGEYVQAWGCKIGHKFLTATNHASHFDRMAFYHCERGIQATGPHYVAIDELNIEHAASGWWVTDYDIDDASNQLHGHLAWHVVLAGTGIDSTFTVNGATNIHRLHLGDNPFGSPSFATPSITLADTAAGGAASTVIRSDSVIAAFDDGADPVTQNFGDTADPGADDWAARRDHVHGMPADPGASAAHYLVIADDHSTPLVFADLVQTEAGDDLVYSD